jgi:hypothetical protein
MGTPELMYLMTSAWAQTVQVEASVMGFFALAESLPSSSMSICRYLCHDFQKTTGPGSAFVVGSETVDVSVLIQLHGFAVLAADIDHRFGRGEHPAGPFSMTCDFRHHLIDKIDFFPAVAGADAVGDVCFDTPAAERAPSRAASAESLGRGLDLMIWLPIIFPFFMMTALAVSEPTSHPATILIAIPLS